MEYATRERKSRLDYPGFRRAVEEEAKSTMQSQKIRLYGLKGKGLMDFYRVEKLPGGNTPENVRIIAKRLNQLSGTMAKARGMGRR
jgi:hypothetical protein